MAMATPIVMPQMGESIAEGTIVRWMKKVGDQVDRDEPLLEISTDKVDAEIPSPVAGVLTEIKVAEGETVPVNSVVGTIGAASEGQGESSAPSRPSPSSPPPPARSAPAEGGAGRPATSSAGRRGAPSTSAEAPTDKSGPAADERQRISPLVRRMAKEHNVDLSEIQGSGAGGRVTRDDVLQYLDAAGRSVSTEGGSAVAGRRSDGDRQDDDVEIQPLSVMRKKIAEHMVLSRRTSAHVHSVFHVNFATVARIREQRKAEYERRGVKLTYMAFIAKAVTDALRRHRLINASLDGSNIVYHKEINLGVAVAIEGGLIVPVVKNADEKNMLGLCRAIADVAERARTKQLKPEEVHGGTFTITNPGQFGAQFGMPIINQPQVAILGIGAVEKRPVVIEDALGIRPMAYLTLGYDHRLIDGATADQFMADVKEQIERFDGSEV
jgi:pyruvate dehydrogenase E2 component (dihydrolipoyllysine-residue acetyltransferase)